MTLRLPQDNMMKKLLIATLCATAFTLTACDKKPTETNGTTAAAVSLSNNVAADIKSDLTAIEALSTAKANEAIDFQTKMMASVQTGDKAALDTVLKDMKSFVDGFNKDLDALTLKSTEADATRNKMKEGNKLGVALTEEGMSAKPDTTKIQELTTKATELQKEMIADMQNLKTKAAEAK